MTSGSWGDRFAGRASVSCQQSRLASTGVPHNTSGECDKGGNECECDFHVEICKEMSERDGYREERESEGILFT